MLRKFSLHSSKISAFESSVLLGKINNSLIKISKIQGDFSWHSHEEEDKAIMVLRGCLQIFLEEQGIILRENEILIIPRQTIHAAKAEDETWIMMIG